MDLRVVDREHLVVAAGFEQVQREMPPVVDGEQVAAAPVGFSAAQEADAVVDLALHLQGVHHGVNAPDVVGVALDRGEADARGPLVVAGLFEAEGVHAPHEPGVRMLGIEVRQRAADAVARFCASPTKKSSMWPISSAEHVGRPPHEQLVEHAGRVVPATIDPRGHGRGVGRLALVERQRRELRPRPRGPRRRRGRRST